MQKQFSLTRRMVVNFSLPVRFRIVKKNIGVYQGCTFCRSLPANIYTGGMSKNFPFSPLPAVADGGGVLYPLQ